MKFSEFTDEFTCYLKCFLSAAVFYHPLRMICLIAYIGLSYFLQTQLLGVRELFISQFLFSCTALFYLIESPLRLIVTVPIRNTAIRLGRIEHVQKNLETQQNNHDRLNFGSVYAGFKRIEKIFSGLERDLLNIIKYVPLMIMSVATIAGFFQNIFIATMFVLLNFASILYIKFWAKLRRNAYIVEEDLSVQIIKLFQNIDRSKSNPGMMGFAKKVLAKENSAYVKAIVAKQYYKIILCLANVLLILCAVKLSLYDEKGIIPIGIFVFNWTQLSISIISIAGMATGLGFSREKSRISATNQPKDIVIKDLSVEGVFEHLNLQIKPSEWVIIRGENGVGKTLLTRLIAKQIRNSSVSSPDDYILINNYSSMFGYEKSDLKTHDLWKNLFAEKYGDLLDLKYPSAGQNAFLCIATAVVHAPSVLIVDESLDLISTAMVEDLINALRTLNMIFIVISHRDDLAQYFDRKLVIQNREIVEA